MELKSIKIAERDGKVLTQIVEGEGATESVRNYSTPATAIAYLNERAAYYKQAQVAVEDVSKGREVTDKDGNKALMFGSIQSAIVYLGGGKPKVDEPKPEAPPAAPEKDKEEAGGDDEAGTGEGKSEGEPTPPASEPKPLADVA